MANLIKGIKDSEGNTWNFNADQLDEQGGSYYSARTGSTQSALKLYLIGATSQGSGDETYSNSSVYIDSNSCLTAPSFNATSDKRLKENIEPLKPIEGLLDLPLYTYDYKDSGIHSLGCMAQDLQKIAPELVVEDDNGYLSVKESKLVYYLLMEVKNLRNEVKKLKEAK